MKEQFVDEVDAKTESAVYDLCPWAAIVVPVERGWRAFESVQDFNIWERQQ